MVKSINNAEMYVFTKEIRKKYMTIRSVIKKKRTEKDNSDEGLE